MESFQTVKISKILEVWESFSGWYWFVTEKHRDRVAFGLVRGHETEWGYFSLDELDGLAKKGKAWRVPRRNWVFCPCVIDDSDDAEGEQSPAASQDDAVEGAAAA